MAHTCRQPTCSQSAKTEVLLLFFGAKPPLDFLTSSPETGSSLGIRKIAADKVVSPVFRCLFWRYQAALLIRNSLHGLVADRDRDCGRIPSARRLASLVSRSRRLRSSLRARFLTSTLPIVVRRRRCRCS